MPGTHIRATKRNRCTVGSFTRDESKFCMDSVYILADQREIRGLRAVMSLKRTAVGFRVKSPNVGLLQDGVPTLITTFAEVAELADALG